MSYIFLQQYWWFIVSLLGSLLVFLMFVQGGNAQIFILGRNESERSLIINSTGRKWELAFTTLVTFGGAFFASFPLFYSTSFGGAYWVWILILLTFVLQAVSYEFQHRISSERWRKVFRCFLVANGWLAPFLIGAAVATFFTGSDFSIDKGSMSQMVPVISQWGNDWHGLEALADYRPWLWGVMLMALTQTLGMLYMLNNIDDVVFASHIRRRLRIVAPVFVVLFLGVAASLLFSSGFAVDADGVVSMEQYKYLHNLVQMPVVLAVFVVGVLLVLWGLYFALFSDKAYRKSVWPAGVGTVLVVLAIFMLAGYNGTAYYPSSTDLQSSLTLSNSCSSQFTLQTMTYVSFIIPFVLAYIVYAWRAIDRKSITHDELQSSEEKY